MKNAIIIITVLCSGLFTSCDRLSDIPDLNEPAFSVTIGDELFESSVPLPTITSIGGSRQLTIAATANDLSLKNVILTINDDFNFGTFNLEADLGEALFSYIPNPQEPANIFTSVAGVVEVTEKDIDTKIISGTFGGILKSTQDSTMRIEFTNGQFTLPYE